MPTADVNHVYPRVTSARVLAALFNAAVGFRLLLPDDSLDSSPGYRLAAVHFVDDVPFGLVLLALGAIQAFGLYSDRAGRLVDFATWGGLLTWLLFAIDLTLVNPSQLGTFAYGILAVGVHLYAYAHLLQWREQLRRGVAP